MSRGFSHAIVGVTSLDEVVRLWVDTFGLSVIRQVEGDDPGLETLWGLPSGSIRRQALVGMPAAVTGRLHLVEFVDPQPAVREGARAFDLCPKNLDVRLTGMQERYEELVGAGWVMGSTPVRMPVDTMEIYEVQLKGPDVTNLSLVELVGDGLPYTPRGYMAVTQVVGTNADNPSERAFFEEVFELEHLDYHLFEGPEVERMVGLPAGAKFDMHILGDPHDDLGKIELVQYVGVEGTDLYPSARPPACGFLGVAFDTDDLDALVSRAEVRGHPVESLPTADTVTGGGPRVVVTSPAGWRIEVCG
ncbi:MAG: hypothetical protein OXS29_16735 [bacterium]|nr:hypothetical protein [bacterium]